MNIGETLKKLRKQNGLKQAEVALYLGVDQSLLAKIESNERTISSTNLAKLCALYGVEIDSLNENDCIKIAFRAESISVEDLKIISEIKQMALDIKFMEMLDDED